MPRLKKATDANGTVFYPITISKGVWDTDNNQRLSETVAAVKGKADSAIQSIKTAAGTNINAVGTPTVTASTSGNETTLTFNYLKGATGQNGTNGTNGTDGTSAYWFSGTVVTGTGTNISATVSNSKAGDMYLNTSTSNVYKATAASKWDYVCNIKGATGSNGTTPTIAAADGSDIATVGTPSVTASTSGTTTTFTFHQLKGAKGDPGQNATTTSVFSDSANGLAPASSSGNKTTAESAVGNYYLCADAKYRQLPANAFKDTTYSSKTAASGGTDVSLVTTGEKYTWNGKQDALTNPVTGSGLTADKIVLGNGTTTVKTSSKGITTTNPSSSSDDTTLPTSKAVWGAITAALGASDAMVFKGTLGTGGNVTAVPTTNVVKGDTYKVITAGTWAGSTCKVGDLLIALTTGASVAANTTNWAYVPSGDETVTTIATSSSPNVSSTAQSGAVTLGTAAAKGVTDNSSNADVASSDTNLITGRTLYYQLAKKGYTTNTGTVTKVSTGAGLTGGDITTTGTVKTNLVSETKLTNAASAATETAGRVYPVALDKDGKLAVNVPWSDNNTTYSAGTGVTITGDGNAINVTYGNSANTACQGNDSRLSNARTPTSHTHGNIQNSGALQTNDITIANGDKLVVTDSSDSSKVARTSIAFDGSTTTKALTQKGTWETFGTSNLAIGTTASTAAAGNHTHTASLATDTGTSAVTLAYGSKYKLTAGGDSVIFTMPASDNTNTTYKLTLNGTDTGGGSTSLGTVYGATTAGTSGQYLKSSGSGAPTWANMPTSLPANGGNADTVDGYHIAVVTSMPASPDANTIYIVK